jgi:hypothetical protein
MEKGKFKGLKPLVNVTFYPNKGLQPLAETTRDTLPYEGIRGIRFFA